MFAFCHLAVDCERSVCRSSACDNDSSSLLQIQYCGTVKSKTSTKRNKSNK